ncbi:MAG: acyltransferase [Bacteroidetes bacterium]|nr:acyltransferase [Bacteroidota bacterium]
MAMILNAGYVQTDPLFGQKEKNFAQVEDLLTSVKADLIVLPELFATGYTFTSKDEVRSLAEEASPGSDTFRFLSRLSIQTGAIIVAGFIEKEDDSIYNASMMVSNNELIGVYRKIHLFNKEKLWFSHGNKPLRTWKVRNLNIGMMICFDWIYPEVCRSLALQGAEVIAHPSNLVMPYCQAAMVTRCLENRVFAITANRIGKEQRGDDHFIFTGESQITAPDGSILSKSATCKTSVEFIQLDVSKATDKKINPFNDLLNDRRPELYS